MKAHWGTNLARPIALLAGDELRTLSDARAYMVALDAYRAERNAWQSAAAKLIAAADGGDVEAATTQVEFALMMDGRWAMT